jgi:putative FmdB family regulatory protein
MPLYEYQCDACGHRFEAIQKFSDPPLERCEKCGGHLQKLVAAPAFQFKGSGWYITDYAKKDSSSSGKKTASGGGTEGGGAAEPSKAEPSKDASTKSDTGAADKPAPTTKD